MWRRKEAPSMRRLPGFCTVILLGAALAPQARAKDFDVPATYATIQAALMDILQNGAAENYINLTASPIYTNATIHIDVNYDCGRKVIIQPKPNNGAMKRATIAAEFSNGPILWIDHAKCVTVRDLDLVRDVTNLDDLVRVNMA